MSVLIELDPFGKPEEGRSRLALAMHEARARNIRVHPVFGRIDDARIPGPALVFGLQAVEQRMRWLAETAATHAVTPLLAVKTCTRTPCLELAQRHLGGYDISNLNEYSVLPENLQGKLVSLTGPVPQRDLGAFAMRGNELLATLDSTVQLDRFFEQPVVCPYVLRVRGPDLLRGAQPADPAFYPVTRFGFSIDELAGVLQDPRVREHPPAGLHVHHGSEMNRQSTFSLMIARLAELVRALGIEPRFMNIGGGWHELGQAEIETVLAGARRAFPQPCRVLIEPGRWYADTAGYAVGTIVNSVQEGAIQRCTLDLSARCHLHWSRPRLLHFTDPAYGQGRIVQFYGASCYESDLIGRYVVPCAGDPTEKGSLVPGARVVFGNISTYSAEWNTSFNGIAAAAVEWVA